MKAKAPRPQHAPNEQGLALCGQRNRTGVVQLPVPRDRRWDDVSCLSCLKARNEELSRPLRVPDPVFIDVTTVDDVARGEKRYVELTR